MTNDKNHLDYLDFEGLNYYDSKIKKLIDEKESNLKIQIFENTQAIEIENERAQNIESVLRDDLQSEIDRAEKSEIDLNNRINDETDRLSNIIDDNKTELQTNIDKEEASRIAEIARIELAHNEGIDKLDNALQSFVREQISNSEAKLTTNYQVADTDIRADLRAEVAARTNKDNLQDAQFESLNDKVESYNNNLNSKIAAHKTEFNILNEKTLNHINNNDNPHNVTREQLGASSQEDHLLLKDRVSTLEEDSVKLNSNETQRITNNIVVGGSLNIEGDLTFNGKAHTIDTETLQVKDNFIVINSDGEDLGESQLSGLSIRINNENAYGIAYDKINDSVSLGSGKIANGDFTFNEGESKPILTRDVSANIKNGSMLIWDAERNIAVDGGIIDVDAIKENFVPKHDHYALEDRVLISEDNIKNLQNEDQKINKFLQDEANALKTNVKSISGGINEIHDQIEEHELNKNNPHNVTWIQINKDALNDSINPYMDDVATIGTSTKVARADHIHPTDTSRAPINHANATNIYGQATTNEFGHVKVDDQINDISINPVQNQAIAKALNSKLEMQVTDYDAVVVIGPDNIQKNIKIASGYESERDYGNKYAGQIPKYYNANGTSHLTTGLPHNKYDCTNKQYVDDLIDTTEKEINGNIEKAINNLDLPEKTLDPFKTIKTIKQIDGKLSVDFQDIQIPINQVTNLNKEFVDIRSEFALQDASIRNEFKAEDDNLRLALEDTQNRVTNIENSNLLTLELNESVSQIKNSIENGQLSVNDKFMLSFEEKLDSAGNFIEYAPIFEKLSIDNGYLV